MDSPSRRTMRRVGILVVVFGLVLSFAFLSGIPTAPARADLGHSAAAAPSSALAAPKSAGVTPAAIMPALLLTPASGVVGITVLVNGSGFTPTTGNAKFVFNGTTPTVQTCTSKTTDAAGNFSCTFVVPAYSPGMYDVNATGADGGADNATAVFTIPAPTIALSPASGVSGTQVTVTGTGFTRLVTIATFTFNASTPALQTCVGAAVNGSGDWSCAFVVPSSLPGPYNVSAVASDGVPDNSTVVFAVPSTSVTVYLNTPVSTYTVLPYIIALNITAVNAPILTTNTWLWLNITDYVTSAVCTSTNISAMITDAVLPGSGLSASEAVTFPLTTAYFVNYSTACPNLGIDPAYIDITATVNGGPNGVAAASAVQFGIYNVLLPPGWGVTPVTSIIFTPVTGVLQVSEVAGQVYTYSMYADYSGQYSGKIQLSIFNTAGTAVIFSSNLRWNGTTPRTVTWTQSTPGSYPYTLGVYTTYGVYNFSGSIAVLPATNVYTNTTSWVNSTFIPGLSAGAAGSILLVVGLIVGMLVAIVVGRLVWGSPKPAPAQPWTPKAGTAANQCSVCGQSFATPEELAAHSKTEHGMQ